MGPKNLRKDFAKILLEAITHVELSSDNAVLALCA